MRQEDWADLVNWHEWVSWDELEDMVRRDEETGYETCIGCGKWLECCDCEDRGLELDLDDWDE